MIRATEAGHDHDSSDRVSKPRLMREVTPGRTETSLLQSYVYRVKGL